MEIDPATGKRWLDRHGVAYGKGFRKAGNIENMFAYDKLKRTGKLLRNLSVKIEKSSASGRNVVLSNRVKYAKDHNEGVQGGRSVIIKRPYTQGAASTIKTGGQIVARPFMNPSKRVIMLPYVLVTRKMREFGWTLGS